VDEELADGLGVLWLAGAWGTCPPCAATDDAHVALLVRV
jgi:hypothetical protein